MGILTANEKYDTPREVVAEITYRPPPLPSRISAAIPKPGSETAYINSLFNPSPIRFDESSPLEAHVIKELVNPHARAKKQERWQRFQRRKDELREEIVAQELQNRNGRSAREATADALYKWRQTLEDEKRIKKKERWMTTDRVKKVERKNKSKLKKKRRQSERLSDLVLQTAPNQFLPNAKGASKRTS